MAKMPWFFKKTNKLQIESKPPAFRSINPNVNDMINDAFALSPKPPTEPALGSTASSSASPNIVGSDEQMENDSTPQPLKENDVGRAPRGKQRRMSSTVFIGQDEAYNQVCNFLKDDKVVMVGIYGMGGVGKTTLMEKLDKEFLKPSNFIVIWVIVHRIVDMDRIQKVIMGKLKLAFNKHDDPYTRADKINDALWRNKVAILFDDIWECLDLEMLGILSQGTLDTGSLKLIFTTRSKAVCAKMQSDELINVQPLGWDDSWALFKRSVGGKNDIERLDSSILALAEEVAKECKGLPLALKVIGGAMACRRLLEEWRHALATLRRYPADIPEAKEYLLTRLKFSFDSLSNRREKGCFLYACLYPEDEVIEANKLIECWIGEGILTLNGSYQEAMDEGMYIFQTLQAVCLFETLQDSPSSTRIHDVIRDMGIWIADSHEITNKTESWPYSVWCERFKLPEEAVCSNLTTLIIRRGWGGGIFCNFSRFTSMSKLRVIKLEGVELDEIPTSIGELTELRHLELIETNLERLPDEIRNLRKLQVMHCYQKMNINLPEVIGELTELRRLVCSTRNIPVEVGNLKKLEELRICSPLVEFPRVICQLVNLKKLFLKIRARVELPIGFGNLNKLEIFELDERYSFHCVELIPNDTFRNMLKLIELSLPIRNFKILPPSFFQGLTSLRRLSIRYKGSRTDEDECIYDDVASFFTQSPSLPLRILTIERCPIKKLQVPPTSNELCFPWLEELHIYGFDRLEKMQVMSQTALPSIRVLKIRSCDSLKHISGLEYLQSLVELEIESCPKLEEVIQVAGDKTLSDHSPGICFPKLEKLRLGFLPQLKSICSDAISFPSPMSQMALPSIRFLKIAFCGSLKHISGLEHLQSLVELEIIDCPKLEEVIQVAGEKTMSDHSPGICFPKLEKLGLENLPQLKSICSDAISFSSLRDFSLDDCAELRVLPRGLVKENKAPERCFIGGGREWYNKLQWQDEDFRAVLDPDFHLKRFTTRQDEVYKQVCNFLQDDEVGMVAIYGIGGVGKTTLMKKIEREFLKPSYFEVIWVVVSKNLDIDRIQEVIMGKLKLAFKKHDHPYIRADKINDALWRNKVAILLDDIWECLDLEMLGILGQANLDTGSFKLIFTTRSKAVCEKMQSDELINVQPLGCDDSWALFKRSVGGKNDIERLDSSILALAEEVAKECKGLPLALKVIGGAMACRSLLEEWRHALATLRHYPTDIPEAKEYLLTRLKFSFDSLSNRREKGCFLYACLYPEGEVIEANKLIECWIGEGILTLNGSYQEAMDEGMYIFQTLQAVCLFETLQDSPLSTRIHDVIHDMGIWIADSHEITNKTESRPYSVWCERFKLPEEAICSNLTTLIIGRGWEGGISHNFSRFTSMSKLRVIKLKGVKFDGILTSIGKLAELRHLELIETNLKRLPDEIRNLRKLQVMHCYQKMNFDLPEAIGELTQLRRLVCTTRKITIDIGNLKKLPVEVGNLKKLEELRIDSPLVEFPQVICQLVNLEKLFLKIQARVALPIGLGNLNKLEIFKLGEGNTFSSDCVELIPNDAFRNMYQLRELKLPIKNFKILPPSFFQGLSSLKRLSFTYHDEISRYSQLWTDEDKIVEEATHMYDDKEYIYDEVASFLTQSSSLPLRILKIKRCPIKKFQVPPTRNDLCFPWLEELHICDFDQLEKMQVMSQMALPRIRVLKITSCHSLKHISGLEHLQSLVELEIIDCPKLEEVIQVAGEKTMSDHSPGICFPKLEKLGLENLPQLKSICSDAISFSSLRDFSLDDCAELRVLPRGLVKENKAPERCFIGGDCEWYSKLQWQDEDFKAALDPHFDEDEDEDENEDEDEDEDDDKV